MSGKSGQNGFSAVGFLFLDSLLGQLLMPSICIGVLLVKTGDPYDPILAKTAFVMGSAIMLSLLWGWLLLVKRIRP
jgi:hypothetical protein